METGASLGNCRDDDQRCVDTCYSTWHATTPSNKVYQRIIIALSSSSWLIIHNSSEFLAYLSTITRRRFFPSKWPRHVDNSIGQIFSSKTVPKFQFHIRIYPKRAESWVLGLLHKKNKPSLITEYILKCLRCLSVHCMYNQGSKEFHKLDFSIDFSVFLCLIIFWLSCSTDFNDVAFGRKLNE